MNYYDRFIKQDSDLNINGYIFCSYQYIIFALHVNINFCKINNNISHHFIYFQVREYFAVFKFYHNNMYIYKINILVMDTEVKL